MPLLRAIRQEEGKLVGITESGKQVSLSTVPTPRVILRFTSEYIPGRECDKQWDLPELRKELKGIARRDRGNFYKLGRGKYEGMANPVAVIPFDVYKALKRK